MSVRRICISVCVCVGNILLTAMENQHSQVYKHKENAASN